MNDKNMTYLLKNILKQQLLMTVLGFRVLLISQYLFPEILLEAVLDVHVGSVKIKSICIQML
jgi:hypothetical protein